MSPETPSPKPIEAVKLPPAATPAKPWLDERKTVPVQTRVMPTVFEKKPSAPSLAKVARKNMWPLAAAAALAGAAATVTVLVIWRLLNA